MLFVLVGWLVGWLVGCLFVCLFFCLLVCLFVYEMLNHAASLLVSDVMNQFVLVVCAMTTAEGIWRILED